MDVRYGRLAIIVNQLRGGGLPAEALALKEKTGADLLLALPEDRAIAERGERGESLAGLPEGNPVVEQLDRLLSEAGIEGTGAGTERRAGNGTSSGERNIERRTGAWRETRS
jgi:hypothetical protein